VDIQDLRDLEVTLVGGDGLVALDLMEDLDRLDTLDHQDR